MKTRGREVLVYNTREDCKNKMDLFAQVSVVVMIWDQVKWVEQTRGKKNAGGGR